ncbi:MAG: hypothetical protein JXA69_00115 [Phycisphaerae bacterium]|nr:hypothetical protein [Phycisphaerae bacterium]
MAETIETFVNKLQADGVRAGQDAANKIRAEAEQQAKRLIAEAGVQAQKLIADAEAERDKVRARAETELRLAARDTIIRLQGSLSRVLRHILVDAVRGSLTDASFVADLLRDIVTQYVRADIEGRSVITIKVSDAMREQLTQWAIDTMHKDREASGMVVDLHGGLAADGFEYKVIDGTVEVTLASVVEVLSGIVGPELRQMVARVATDGH